jgi:hypothetical protein
MDSSAISVRDLRVLRNRGRVTAEVSFSRFGQPGVRATVELDLGRSDVKEAVEKLEQLAAGELLLNVASITAAKPEDAAQPAPPSRKRSSRAVKHV